MKEEPTHCSRGIDPIRQTYNVCAGRFDLLDDSDQILDGSTGSMSDLLGNDAYVSECGKYRYSLERHVGAGAFTYAFFGINPSTADAMTDDQTVRKWRGFSERNHVGRFIVSNVFSYRATDVKELAQTTDDLFGEDHWRIQDHIIRQADALVPCWGSQKKVPDHLRVWIDELLGRLKNQNYYYGTPLLCFGHTKDDDPKHPLTLGYDTPMIDYLQ